ncbi:hypothetical protein ABH975_006367 [Bradyrhizobium ottawaense]
MGMWNSLRLLTLLLGGASLWWSITVLPIFRSAAPVRDATARIMAGDLFKSGTLDEMLARFESEPKSRMAEAAVVRARALVHLAVAELSMQRKKPEEADGKAVAAENDLKFSLVTNPTDSFVWVLLYSVHLTRNGLDANTVRYLEESYATGPLEGWISLRRSRLALAAFSVLGAGAKEKVVSEFIDMVDSGFIDDTFAILTTVGWTHRDLLLSHLERADILSREALARRLRREGIWVDVPGVKRSDRPW